MTEKKVFNQNQCYHPRIKRNYPFGKKSKPTMVCKKCGEVITPYKLKQLNRTKRKKNGRNKRK